MLAKQKKRLWGYIIVMGQIVYLTQPTVHAMKALLTSEETLMILNKPTYHSNGQLAKNGVRLAAGITHKSIT